MFNQSVLKTAFTTDEAEDYFRNIVGSTYIDDKSFISTLRALVARRMQENDGLYLRLCCLSASNLFITREERVRKEVDNYEKEENSITVVEISEQWVDKVKTKFTRTYHDWEYLETVTAFFRKHFNVLCFINLKIKSVMIFVDGLNHKRIHHLQCAIPRYLPWYFCDSMLSDLEIELLKSLCQEKSPMRYMECISKIAQQYDLRSLRIRRLLSDFEDRTMNRACTETRSLIQTYTNKINELNEQIKIYLQKINRHETKLLGLEMKIAKKSETPDLMDYFLRNDKISLERVDHEVLSFAVKAYLEYFDEGLARQVITNDYSYVYTAATGERIKTSPIFPEQMRMLMTAIFLERRLKVRFCAAYSLWYEGNIRPEGNYSFTDEYEEYIPNPHIQDYMCMGNYTRTVNELVLEHDYIGAIEQCVASCMSLNFSDSTVMRRFINKLYFSDKEFIELPDGIVVSPIGAIEWLEAQEV